MVKTDKEQILVSSEIADDIDESQFFLEESVKPEVEEEISSALVIHFTTEKVLVPGIVLSYGIREIPAGGEEVSIKFLTDNSNILAFESNDFERVGIYCGDDAIRTIDLSFLVRRKILVEQDLNKMGSIITVVYS